MRRKVEHDDWTRVRLIPTDELGRDSRNNADYAGRAGGARVTFFGNLYKLDCPQDRIGLTSIKEARGYSEPHGQSGFLHQDFGHRSFYLAAELAGGFWSIYLTQSERDKPEP
jgi:hypothetical protein